MGEPQITEAPAPGTPKWLRARIAEHKAAQEQALASANAHSGAMQAFQRLLDELEKAEAGRA